MKKVTITLNAKFSAALSHYQKVIQAADPRPLSFETIVESGLLLLWGDEATKAEREALEIATGQPHVPNYLRGLLRK
jgi:hypothetical protein